MISAQEQFNRLTREQRFAGFISGVIAVISLLVVIAGVVGMVSYMVSLRRYGMGLS